jgi:hypothetical protein
LQIARETLYSKEPEIWTRGVMKNGKRLNQISMISYIEFIDGGPIPLGIAEGE